MRISLLAVPALLLFPLAIAAAAPRDDGEARLAKLLKGRTAGEPVDCIDFHRITGVDIVDRTAIVYRLGSQLYVNRPDAGLRSLNRSNILVTDTGISKLCDVDVVRLVDQAQQVQSGFVNLGKFVPYTRHRRD
ncbi:MAG: hypothetical protein ABW173_10630 [Sphingomonas sp.]